VDDTTAGPRITALHAEIDQLQARHHEITDTIGNEPAAPPPRTIQRLGTYLHDILDAGTPAQRKAAIEALIAEIRIAEEGLIPVFRIPSPNSPIPGMPSGRRFPLAFGTYTRRPAADPRPRLSGAPAPKPATPASARTTTNSATPAARPATTSAASNAPATRSPSRPSTPTPASSTPQPAKPRSPLPTARRRWRAAWRCRLPG
jgi:hypothetical protein